MILQERWYQNNAEQSIYDYFASKQGNCVLAMPTASGKAVVIAKFIRNLLQKWPNQRIIIATHVKELVKQNYNKIIDAWPDAPAGIYSAGLKQRDIVAPVIFGNIQSMAKKANLFGHRDLLIVDECHLISGKDNSNYGRFINGLKAINPALKVIGFSATHWRMGHGLISDGPIFTDVCYDLTTIESFQRLISEGFLSLLIPKKTSTVLDVSKIKIKNGEYDLKQQEEEFDRDPITYAACQEIIKEGYDRKSWLIFASGIKHAKHIAAMMQSLGVDARAVHSKMLAACGNTDKPNRCNDCRDCIIDDFRNYRLHCVVNYGVLTTGFDHPGLDLIAVLRATTSSSLWVQMLGRGMRPSLDTGKVNCLVLDFAGNTLRLGPINDPVIPVKKGQKAGVAPVRICEECGTYNHARSTVCINCGAVFEFNSKLTYNASTAALIKTEDDAVVQAFNVRNVIYNRYEKRGSPAMIRVDYWSDLQQFSEYICFEHSGFAAKKARDWWRSVLPGEPPVTTDQALLHLSQAKMPRQIMVHTNTKFPQVIARIF
jgi:DNA repair protein RadD